MSRVPPINADELSAADRAIYDAIAGPRGGLGGPFAVWFLLPDLAERINAMVDRLRFKSMLQPRIYELVTLLVARAWSAEFIWRAHVQAALKAGLSADVLGAIENNAEPPFTLEDERQAFTVVRDLLANHAISDGVYARAEATLGAPALVEIVSVAGYYTMNAMISKTFDVR